MLVERVAKGLMESTCLLLSAVLRLNNRDTTCQHLDLYSFYLRVLGTPTSEDMPAVNKSRRRDLQTGNQGIPKGK